MCNESCVIGSELWKCFGNWAQTNVQVVSLVKCSSSLFAFVSISASQLVTDMDIMAV